MTTLEAHLPPASPVTPKARRVLRSVGAVFGGLVATFVVTTAVDVALHQTGVFPPMSERMADSLFVVALAYRIPFNTLGCYLAARLAPANPKRHAYALGFVGIVLATLGAIAMWDCGPAWYSLANIAVALPCAWLGGRLGSRARA
jgi:hypothetical protein